MLMSAHWLQRVVLIAGMAIALLGADVFAQTPAATDAAVQNGSTPAEIAEATASAVKADVQKRMQANLEVYGRQQQELKALLARRNELPPGKTDPELDKAIEAEQKQIKDLRQQFIELATNNYNLLENNEPPQVQINWQDEMLQVVYPLLREMKRLSDRPRQIESLSTEIGFYSQRVVELKDGLAHLQEVIAQTDDPKLIPPLTKLQKKTADTLLDTEHKLDTLQRRYDDLRSDSKPIMTAFGDTIHDFATGMGWHMVIGISLAGAAYFFVILIVKLPLHSLEKRNIKGYVFIERAVHFFSRIFATLIALLVLFMVLYSLNEWALLGLAAIILVAVLLSLRDTLPNYMTEIRTMLNLGSIRQGERLIFNGLPWRVAELDFYTVLHNPALSGLLRVPLTQISRLSSRPYHDDEPWFPTKEGDFVLMGDGTFGRVQRQTPEVVQLNFGESQITYPTDQFLGAKPRNLSSGFAVSSSFGIDYRHQCDILPVIEKQLQEGLEQALQEQDFALQSIAISVEYMAAAASSLDFRLLIQMRGEAADNYWRIQRWLQRAALECANRHGWEIPFQQITVHTAAAKADA